MCELRQHFYFLERVEDNLFGRKFFMKKWFQIARSIAIGVEEDKFLRMRGATTYLTVLSEGRFRDFVRR
jgi:hypothetical protein